MPGLQQEVPAQRTWSSLPNVEDQRFNSSRGSSNNEKKSRCIPITLAVLVVVLIAVIVAGAVSVRNGGGNNSKAVGVPAGGADTDLTNTGGEETTDASPLDDTTPNDEEDQAVEQPAEEPADEIAEEPAQAASEPAPEPVEPARTEPAPVPEPDFGSIADNDDFSMSLSMDVMSMDNSNSFGFSASMPGSVDFSGASVDFSASFSLRRKERMLRKETVKKARRTKRLTKRAAH